MLFKDFVIDEETAEKKRKEISSVIAKAVKKNLIEKEETEGTTFIKFAGKGLYDFSPATYEIHVVSSQQKKVYKGMQRVVHINIVKEKPSNRQTDYLVIDIDRISDAEYATTLEYLKDFFGNLIK